MKFQTVRIEGNTISADILDKISEGEYKGQQVKDFGLEPGVKIKDEIARAWADAQSQWKIFKSRTANLDDADSGLPEVRKYWMIPFLGLLDYNLEPSQADKLENGNSYPISHRETRLDRFPVYIVGYQDKEQGAPEERSTLDIKPSNATRRMSPHALVQEYVNLTEYAYGIVTNGLQLRLLRDSSRLVKLSFLEFDLEQMMEEEAFADFALLFRVLHASRLPRSRSETADSLIEQYHQDSIESGARIREGLSAAVEKSIRAFANGFLKHPSNQQLRDAIIKKQLSAETYYQQQLRLIYRLLFLMVTEERNLVYPDQHNKKLRDIYYQYYSVERLRRMVDKRLVADARYGDHWEGLKHTFQLFEKDYYGSPLGIKPLNGDLFGINALGLLIDCALDNLVLLDCIRNLTLFVNKNSQQVMRVNYASLNVEEFGSVYEGLLDYDPVLHITDEKTIEFDFKSGEGRSSSGSHYTPEELVQPLIKHSLDYIIQNRLKEKDRDGALLSIKVCDVACGSGHILLSAARRIATELARVRTGEDQPAPAALRVAIRDVIKNCVYGVDKNPLAVELCKVALWLESHNPGEPLGFLDHHIKCGDAIVGLAHRDELLKGIANEAFKTLPGDDKDIATSFLRKNRTERMERKQGSLQLETQSENAVQGNVREAMIQYDSFVKLPEQTPEDVEAKQRAYRKFLNGKGVSFLRTMADTQVAQFFIPKNQANKDRLMTDAEFRQVLTGHKAWQSTKTSYSTVPAEEQRFFHWFLEFPEVFQNGGFDCILGNPPFLGGLKISSNFGDSYLLWLLTNFAPAGGTCDEVAYFFRRNFQIIGKQGFLSLIATNTIAQGDTREGGLEPIVMTGGQINFAIKAIKWPGQANLEVSLVSLSKGFKTDKFLNNSKVALINTLLEDSAQEDSPRTLYRNLNRCFQGTTVLGKGFILQKHEAEEIIRSDGRYEDVVFPYLIGDDINNDPSQVPSRYIINFRDWDEGKAKQYLKVYDIVKEKVRPEREKVNREARRRYWWRFGDRAVNLYNRLPESVIALAVCRVTKFLSFSIIPKTYVYDVGTNVILLESLCDFAVLSSVFHDLWARKFGSSLESRLRYTNEDCFETFPFPSAYSDLFGQRLEETGSSYVQHRSRLMVGLQLGLTKTYNMYHSNSLNNHKIVDEDKRVAFLRTHLDCTATTISFIEAVKGILKLRELHVKMDHAVLEAYGWNDIQLRHDFYEVDYLPANDRVRFTIHPDARKEVLKRLLELNHKIHGEEVKAGLGDKKKGTKAKGAIEKVEEPRGGYGGLFD